MMAQDLYDSALWRKRRTYAERSGLPWVIFSAKHGILRPDATISYCDVALKKLPANTRRAKGREAAKDLEKLFGPLAGETFEIHAGDAYVIALRPALKQMGADLINPLEGLRLGYQLAWYADTPAAEPVSPRVAKKSEPLETSRVHRFRLRFPAKDIPRLARQYSYGGDARMAALGRIARSRGWFERAELVELCHWKTPRSGPLVRKNLAAAIHVATKSALSARSHEDAIAPLLSLRGVSWPTASVILHFAHRDPYPILDVKPWRRWAFGDPDTR